MAPPTPSSSSSRLDDPQASRSFVPRPFPPPSLAGVPHEYIIDSLRKLAPQYWNNTDTADCSISERTPFVIPAPRLIGRSISDRLSSDRAGGARSKRPGPP
ncbi:hypothetical protein BV25DRAFT_282116 [Artomyces pyxidatus]|uniref:Uncharacterized protein n=1 Tax=Artomyces pyxidatus TaxID=48021 RepID=A0ACB8T996_9AGAM|nr:hypothetical protein BV25DRAFT_282116 [Artomyces pyxidatus]